MKPNVLHYDDHTLIGTATDLYLEMRRKVAENMLDDAKVNISDALLDIELLDELSSIMSDALQDETALYMIVWSAMHFPSIWKLEAGKEPLWEK